MASGDGESAWQVEECGQSSKCLFSRRKLCIAHREPGEKPSQDRLLSVGSSGSLNVALKFSSNMEGLSVYFHCDITQ